jgi:protein-disulfide isomerase
MTRKRIGLGLVGAVAVLLLALTGYRLWLVHKTIADLGYYTMGAATGPNVSRNVIIDFLDYRCSACRLFNPTVEQFAHEHPDVKIVFRHFPLYLGPSIREAALALAAVKQHKFMEMHDYLMSRQNAVDPKEIPAIAQQLGLDPDQLQKDMKASEIGYHLDATLDATQLLNIHSAPSFMINGTIYITRTSLPDLKQLDALYAKDKR